MTTEFQNYLLHSIALTNEQLDWITSLCTTKILRKNQYLLQEGDVWKHYAFVSNGCLRTYSTGCKGTEHVIGLHIENSWAGDYESLITAKPSHYNIDCIEPSEVVLCTKQNFERICKEIPAFYELAKSNLNRSLVASQNRIMASLSYTAEQQYAYFAACYPQLVNRVPQNMIASYLGIAKETLSRMRTKSVVKAVPMIPALQFSHTPQQVL
ncbi:Crp/Fnr family transcriptional regulator [Flavobacterium rivuli]|uniref:Crp/Fnr family transcriptional regulator n=1 Tax=Flavobacterium rivuli TaxID=498301 RepID=UPI0003704B4C|nr:Crp/Fnr family transcriptional regulator [Flavobacterium rivuli]